MSFQTKKSYFLREHAQLSSALEAGVWYLSSTSVSIHPKQTAAAILKPKYGKHICYLKYLPSSAHTLAGATEFLS